MLGLALLTVAVCAPLCACGDVGILYEVWHSSAATAMAKLKAAGAPLLTVEQVLQSAGALSLDDVYVKHGLNGDIYGATPVELGFYCLYRARAGDPSPPLPDCANTTGVTTRHAAMLTGAGFDYVAVDVTNWPTADVNGPTGEAAAFPPHTSMW